MRFFKKNDYKIITTNFSYLALLRFMNVGIKFILVAYLVRILGSENYGLVTWLDSIIQYFIMLINFGFNIYAAKYVIEKDGDNNKLNELISSVLTIKAFLFLFSILLIFGLTFFDSFSSYRFFLLIFILCGIGEVLFPIWFFQGKENLKPATIIVFCSRILIVVFTYLFIKTEHDSLYYIIILVISSLVMGISGIMYMLKNYNLKFIVVPIKKLYAYCKESFPFFLGMFLSLVFNFGSIFFIGKFCGMNEVAGFDVCLKIVLVSVIPIETLRQAIFPTLSRNKDKKMLKRIIKLTIIYGIISTILIYSFSEILIGLFGGDSVSSYTHILKKLVLVVPFMSLTFILGSCSLIAFGYYREFNKSLIYTSIIYFFILILLYSFNMNSLILIVYLRVFADILLLAFRIFYIIKKKVLI